MTTINLFLSWRDFLNSKYVSDYYAQQAKLWTKDGLEGGSIGTHIDSKLTCDWLLFTENELKNADVLNVGSHFPTDELHWAKKAKRWVTCDIAEDVVLKQKEIFKDLSEWVHYDGFSLPFQDGTFSHIFSFSTFEHIPGEDARKTHLAELSRVLKPGGVLCMSTHFVEFSGSKDTELDCFGYTHMFTMQEFLNICDQHFDIYHIGRMGGNGNRIGFRLNKK